MVHLVVRVVSEDSSQLVTHGFDAGDVIGDLARGKTVVDGTDIGWHETVREALACSDDAFLNIKLNVNESPVEFLFQIVGEFWGISKSPFPSLTLMIDLHELWDFF